MRALGAKLIPGTVRRSMESTGRALISRCRRNIRSSVRRPQFHRRPRNDGTRDSRGCAGHGRGHRQQSAAAGSSPASCCASKRSSRRSKFGVLSRRQLRPPRFSFEKGSPQVFKDWKASFVDGAGGQSVFPRMWERMKPVVDDYIVVSLEETRKAMRLMAEKTRVISEGAGALLARRSLTGKAGKGPIVAVVSGGNIDLEKFSELIAI